MTFFIGIYRLLKKVFWYIGYYGFPWQTTRRLLLLTYTTQVGYDVDFEPNMVIFGGRKIFIGNHVKLHDVLINAVNGEVHIGDGTFFGHRAMLLTGSHKINFFGVDRQKAIVGKPIHLGEGVWVGSGAIILGGVSVGDGAVIAAGAVVTQNISAYSVVGGVPARLIKNIEVA